jgi:hypothetical protein
MSYLLAEHRQAIALSNMGVSLLEKGLYREALETIKDSVVAIKGLYGSQRCRSQNEHDVPVPLADEVKRAYRRLAQGKREIVSISIEVIADDDGFCSIKNLKKNLTHSSNFSICYPIRIDSFNSDMHCLDFHSGIVLHNFSTAHLCLSRLPALSPKRAQKLRDGAYKVGCLANKTLAKLILDDNEATFCGQVLQETSLFIATLATLKTLVSVLHESGCLREAKAFFQRMLDLQGAVLDVGDVELYCTMAASAA